MEPIAQSTMGEWINKMIDKHSVEVTKDSDGNLIIPIPQCELDRLAWEEGDTVYWTYNSTPGDERWVLRLRKKKDD